MNRNRKGKMPEITRDIYKGAKKFDHQQFTAFCMDLYSYGYEDGRESVPGVDLETIMNAIRSVKGIGEKRLDAIRASIEAVFRREGGQQ